MCLTLPDSPAKPPAATASVTETVCVYGLGRRVTASVVTPSES